MKTRLIVSDPKACKAERIGGQSNPDQGGDRTLTGQGLAVCRYANTFHLGSSIISAFRETLRTIVMITDPERVRETLGLPEKEPGIDRVTHD
jgi:hypothetical protein